MEFQGNAIPTCVNVLWSYALLCYLQAQCRKPRRQSFQGESQGAHQSMGYAVGVRVVANREVLPLIFRSERSLTQFSLAHTWPAA